MIPGKTSGDGSSALMGQIQHLLDHQRVAEAFEVLKHCGQESPAVRNARGVCLMRMGKPDTAARVFSGLVFRGGIAIPSDTPTVFRTNYVTALLLLNSACVGCDLLSEIPDRSHPAVQRLEVAVRRWKQSLPWWRRMLLSFGMYPGKPPLIDFPPGDLWVAESQAPERPNQRAA